MKLSLLYESGTGFIPIKITGWKFHLNLSKKPKLVEDIGKWLDKLDIKWKGIDGMGGPAGGTHPHDIVEKGMTIYVGRKSYADQIAREIHKRFGSQIPPAEGSVLQDDIQFIGNIWGRFDASKDNDFDHYGHNGIPYLKADRRQFVRKAMGRDNTFNADEAYKAAYKLLKQKYGRFFTG